MRPTRIAAVLLFWATALGAQSPGFPTRSKCGRDAEVRLRDAAGGFLGSIGGLLALKSVYGKATDYPDVRIPNNDAPWSKTRHERVIMSMAVGATVGHLVANKSGCRNIARALAGAAIASIPFWQITDETVAFPVIVLYAPPLHGILGFIVGGIGR